MFMEMPLTINSGKKIGDVGCLSGEWDETEFNIFVLNDNNYNIIMMSTFSGLTVPESQKEVRSMVSEEVVKLKYPEVVADHFRYRGAVENHNDLRHDDGTKYQFYFKSERGTTWWPIRVFDFFIACTEVNACLAMKYFLKTDDKCMDFKNNWLRG